MNARTIARRGTSTALSGALSGATLIRRQLAQRRLTGMLPGSRLHLGCGPNRLDGWVNLDIDAAVHPDVRLDLRVGLPVPESVASLIYSEHVLEHFSLADGARLLADCYRALAPGGILRIAMPDLSALVEHYRADWRAQDWLQDSAYAEIDTPAHMLNYALREWGHRYLYDFEDLAGRLQHVGFRDITRVPWGNSSEPMLRDLETRKDSQLVVEARKS
jgi:predicted SAM-dependent methyltransferase